MIQEELPVFHRSITQGISLLLGSIDVKASTSDEISEKPSASE